MPLYLLQAMDAFVFPSMWEGFSVSLVEAQASGLPIFASPKSLGEDVFLTDCAIPLLLEDGPEFWAQRILDVCGEYQRTDKSEQVWQKGYAVEDSAHWVERFYKVCVEKRFS